MARHGVAPTVIYPGGLNQLSSGMRKSLWILLMVELSMFHGLQNNKSDIVVGKSTDFGVNWSFVVADHTNSGTDKPILAVRGQDVYVFYNHSQTAFVAYSHDGGATFTEVKINQNAKLGWSLGGGGTVTPDGNVILCMGWL